MSRVIEATNEFELDGDIEARDQTTARGRENLLGWGVALLTPFFVAQIMQLFPSLSGVPVVKVFVVAVILIFITSRGLIANRVRLLQVPQLKLIVLFLALALAVVPFSVWPSNSLNYILDVYIKNVIFLYLVVQAARQDASARRIATALVAGCALLVMAMLTGFGPVVTYSHEPGRFAVGGSYDANDLALLFVVVIPFAYFLLKSSSLGTRLFLLGAIGLMLVGIIKSGSRGGFLGLVIIGFLILRRSSRRARKYALATLGVGVLLFAFAAPPSYWERIGTIFNYEQDYNATSQTGRLSIWRTGLEMVVTRPLTGVGVASFPVAHSLYTGTRIHISPHNTFVQVAAELGIIGFLLFVGILWRSLAEARRTSKRARRGEADEETAWLAGAMEVSLIGFIVSASFLTHAYSPIICFLIGMAGALAYRCREQERQRAREIEEIEYA